MKSNSICIKKKSITGSKYTIAIPTYKRADLLKEAVESAARQNTDIIYNILVVDNNPERNDETEQMINHMDIPNLSYYKNKENLGMVGNWNQLYILAETEWVIMLHDDDLISDFYIEIFDKLCNRKEFLDIKVFAFPYINSSVRNLDKLQFLKKEYLKAKILDISNFICGNVIGVPIGLAVNREYAIKNIFDNNYYPAPDNIFYIEAAYHNAIVNICGFPFSLRYTGVNESLKNDTIVKFVESIGMIHKKIRHLCNFKYKIYDLLCRYSILQKEKQWIYNYSSKSFVDKIMDEKYSKTYSYFEKKISRKLYRRLEDNYYYNHWIHIVLESNQENTSKKR